MYLAATDVALSSALIVEDKDEQRPIYFSSKVLTGVETCNHLLEKLVYALLVSTRKLRPYSDSQLVVGHMNGEFEAKEPTILKYVEKARYILRHHIWAAQFTHILRFKNTKADSLAKLASKPDARGRSSIIRTILECPSIEGPTVLVIETTTDWRTPIIEYIRNGTLPPSRNESRKVLRRASHYFLWGNDLYHRGHSMPCLRCVGPNDARLILEELHDGLCGSHQAAPTLKRKVLISGYYWPSIIRDATELVKTCRKCQEHTNHIHIPGEDMRPMESP